MGAVSACPKCGTACVAGAAACSKCGLATDRMESFARERDASVPDALGLAWARAEESWDQPARHEEVLRLVTQHDAYAWAAAQYRGRAGDPIADKQIERVRKAAEVTLLSSSIRKDASERTPYRNTIGLLIAMVVLILGALLYVWVRSSRNSEPTPASIEGDDR